MARRFDVGFHSGRWSEPIHGVYRFGRIRIADKQFLAVMIMPLRQ